MSNVSRRTFLKTTAVTAMAGSLAAYGHETRRPNIVLVMTDQEPLSCIGPYGNTVVQTPARDAIANGGVRFNNYYTAAYACSPSRATMITGRYTHNHGIFQNDMWLPSDMPALGNLMAAQGYETAWIGKSHLGGETRPKNGVYRQRVRQSNPVGIHFEFIDGGVGEDGPIGGFSECVGGWQHYRDYLQTTDLPKDIKNDGWVGNHNNLPTGNNSTHAVSRIPEEHNMAAFLTDNAVERLNRFGDKPFCLVLSYYGPHTPVSPPNPWADRYPLDAIELPRNFRVGFNGKPIMQRTGHGPKGPKRHWSEAQFIDYIRRYYGYVAYLDKQLQRVLDALATNKQADNTIIAFTSDHGDMLAQFGMTRKTGNGYDTLMNVPFMIRYPAAIQPGQVEDGVASSVDLLPTLLDLAGVPLPDGLDGVSMKARLVNGRALPRERVFTDVANNLYMVREGDWKFCLNASTAFGHPSHDIDELYNMKDDPWEMTNLAGRPEQAERVATMKEHILLWLDDTGHPYAKNIREAASLAVPVCAPLEPMVTAIDDLGDGKVRIAYVWRCMGPLDPRAEGARDTLQLVRDSKEEAQLDTVLEQSQPTTPSPATWERGLDYPNVFEVTLPDGIEPGQFTVYIGMNLKQGQPRFCRGFVGRQPGAKLMISKDNGIQVDARLYWYVALA